VLRHSLYNYSVDGLILFLNQSNIVHCISTASIVLSFAILRIVFHGTRHCINTASIYYIIRYPTNNVSLNPSYNI